MLSKGGINRQTEARQDSARQTNAEPLQPLPEEESGMTALLSQLSQLRDMAAIRKAVLSLCSSAGRVRYCLFEHNRDDRVLQCYVQLIDRELHEGLAYRLGGYVRGRELYIPIPVTGDFVMPKETVPRQ